MSLLTERANDIRKEEKITERLKLQKETLRAEIWLKTDFDKVLNKKRSTEKDKEAYVSNNEEYKNIQKKIIEHKSTLNYNNRIFDICFNDKYNKKEIQ